VVHGTGVYSAGVGPKGPALERFLDIKKKSFPKRFPFMNNRITRLPDCVVQCSKASTLLQQGNFHLDRVPEKLLQGFESLRVLNMSRTRIHSLPLSLLQLGELRALLLGGCFYLEEFHPLEGPSRL
jgi:disease resistance protein RPS2